MKIFNKKTYKKSLKLVRKYELQNFGELEKVNISEYSISIISCK
jgi:hypothetical protein